VFSTAIVPTRRIQFTRAKVTAQSNFAAQHIFAAQLNLAAQHNLATSHDFEAQHNFVPYLYSHRVSGMWFLQKCQKVRQNYVTPPRELSLCVLL